MSCIPVTLFVPPLLGAKASRRQLVLHSAPRQETQALPWVLVAHSRRNKGRGEPPLYPHSSSKQDQGRGPISRSFALPLGATSSSGDEYLEPVPGAVVFRRNAIRTHYEVATSLEELGLKALSSDISRETTLEMGLKAEEKNTENGSFTPVAVSWDVEKDGRDLRLNGVAVTAISAICNKCLAPMAERISGEFSLLLTEKPVEEPTQERIGVVLAGPTHAESPDEQGAGLLDLDLDDKIHFPRGALEVDISKYIRDTVHLEIPAISSCSGRSCKGLCTTCGLNLNKSMCNCSRTPERESKWSALDQLRKQLTEQEATES